MEKFLNEVKDAKYGVTVFHYENVRKLRDQIKHDIIVNTVTTYYRKGREKELLEITWSKNETIETKAEPSLEMDLPSKVIVGVSFKLSASTIATTSKGFLDLLLVAPDGRRLWFPDPRSWKGAIDTGSMQLNNEKYESEWTAIVPSSYPEGKYQAMMGLYDDDPQRRLIAKSEGFIAIKGKPYQEIISLLREFIARWPVYKKLIYNRKLNAPENGEISWYAKEIARKLSVMSGLDEEEQIRKLSQDMAVLGIEIYQIFPTHAMLTSDEELEKLVSRGENLSKKSEDITKPLDLTSR